MCYKHVEHPSIHLPTLFSSLTRTQIKYKNSTKHKNDCNTSSSSTHKKETQQHPQISFSPFPGDHTIQQQQKTIKPSTNITNAKASHIIQKHKHNSTFSPPPINPNLTPADSLILSLLPTPTPQPTNPSPQ